VNWTSAFDILFGGGKRYYDKNTCYAPLGAFAKLQKATISLVTSVCPSVRMEKLGSQWTDFGEI
jgi:hypothetical protein